MTRLVSLRPPPPAAPSRRLPRCLWSRLSVGGCLMRSCGYRSSRRFGRPVDGGRGRGAARNVTSYGCEGDQWGQAAAASNSSLHWLVRPVSSASASSQDISETHSMYSRVSILQVSSCLS